MVESHDEVGSLSDSIRQGDVRALAKAFESYDRRLRTIIGFRLDPRLSRRIDVADVIQEGYLNAFKRHEHLEGVTEQELFVWLRLIVLQTVADVHRRHLAAQGRDVGKEQFKPAASHTDHTSLSVAARLVGNLTSPSGAFGREELSQQVRAALDEMNEIDREVLALRHFEELTNQEVATVLNIEPKAASIRYIRALKRLKDLIVEIPGLNGSSDKP
ncbi:MAG: sigma-70 family RNA polymerase sigma factor [Planctomycetes bacterium]|nr:sigma-70 family RNA polymerase sigma factor [Planctomycetota bacterium]MBI3833094.1 sigma-70 family RNA polymerase sigma factor [Planctomycetota bacterium]